MLTWIWNLENLHYLNFSFAKHSTHFQLLGLEVDKIELKILEICGLYYKHVMIVNDDSSIVSKWGFKLIDDPRVIIYDRHRFIIQATGKFGTPSW